MIVIAAVIDSTAAAVTDLTGDVATGLTGTAVLETGVVIGTDAKEIAAGKGTFARTDF